MTKVFTTIAFIIAYGVLAQTPIAGKVTDERGESIPGANITIQDSYDGASSDENGSFHFTTTEQGSKFLVVTFVGFKTVEQAVELNGKPISITIKLFEDINQLDAVVISAGSFTAGEEKRRTILKAMDIATTAGATADIAGALNTLPGTQKVGESGRLFVRGGDGTETRTFIDGMLVLNAYGPSAPNTPSRGRFLPFMFKGTSFSTGGYSAEYGQALSSALILNSRDISTTNQTDIGILSVGVDVGHTQAWKHSSLSGKIQYTNLRPYNNLIDQRVDWKLPPVSLESSAAYRIQTKSGGMFKFFGNLSRTDFSMYAHDIANPDSKVLYDLENAFTHGNASYQQNINAAWMVRGGISYTRLSDDIKLDGLPMNKTEDGIHVKVVTEYEPSERVEVKFGTEIINRFFNASRWNESSSKTESTSFNETLPSAFGEVQVFASNRLVAKTGGRFEYNSVNTQYSLDPRASVAYKPGKKGQFSFAYGTFRQAAKNEFVMFNHQLKSEKAEHFILNYQVVTDRRTFRTEIFYKKYGRLIKYINNNPTDLNNEGYGYAKGLEIFWRDNQTFKGVDYWVSYSFLDTKRSYLNFPASGSPPFASAHNLSVVYKHFIQKLKTQVGLTYSISSGRTYFDPNIENLSADKTPFYQDVSMNLSYLPKSWLIIHASCSNVLGRDNVFGYEFASMAGPDGVYASRAIRQPAARFLFLGVFITISKNKSINQLPNL